MLWIANQLDIKVTTQGDRSKNPADTRFVRMVFDFEKLLPRRMRFALTLALLAPADPARPPSPSLRQGQGTRA